MLKILFAATATFVAFEAFTVETQAASRSYCAGYARSAVEQYRANTAIPGCFKGADARWHPDYDRHFEACLDASVEAMEGERNYRSGRLEGCRERAAGRY
jgi:hypothetical protein